MAPNNRLLRRALGGLGIRGLSLLEMFITVAIVSLLLTYAYKFYFQGRETMRFTQSQQQMQAESRWFLDQMGRDIASAYRFIELSPDKHSFRFYAFQQERMVLEDMLYDTMGNPVEEKDRKLKALLVEYVLNPTTGIVSREQKPVYVYFLRPNLDAVDQPQAEWSGDASCSPGKKDMLRNIADFEFFGYEQNFNYKAAPGDNPIIIRKVDGTQPADARKTTFIALRVHSRIDEKTKDRKDEELDLVAKFYSRVRLADAAYPGYFSQTDDQGAF